MYALIHQSLLLDWKTHIISPVYKSGNKSAVNNYRPISLLCVVSKVLERIIFNKISDFITVAISPNQFGFLCGRSCTQQLLLFLNDIYDSAANKIQTDVLYLDFRKAFDTIPHNKLLEKLYKIGISGNLWKWFHCYLANRVQCVRVNHKLSDMLPVLSGVPQGSILGPLLFLCSLMTSLCLSNSLKFSCLPMTLSAIEGYVMQLPLQSYKMCRNVSY